MICFLFFNCYCFGKTKIYGSAINSYGQFVHVFTIDDFISNAETHVHTTSVDKNERFYIELEDMGIRKIVIRINNAYAQLYVQDGADYYIEFPEESFDNMTFFSGNETEILFFNLDSTDINYKILGFEAWMDDELADLYIIKDVEPNKFIEGVLRFKNDVQVEYREDTCSYFRAYIKYSLGKNVDNINYFGAPTKLSKYNFFIRQEEIHYQNPAYMDFVLDFYDRYLFQMDGNVRRSVIQSIHEQNSKSMINALTMDSLIPTEEFAELIALKIIQDEYAFGNLSKNDLIRVTNQIEFNGLNTDNRKIAYNLIEEFYTIIEGDPLPEVKLNEQYLKVPAGKFLYIHFFDPGNPSSLSEVSALKKLYEKYSDVIGFVSLYLDNTTVMSSFKKRVLKIIDWDVHALRYEHPLWKSLNIGSFPHYILVSPSETIVGLPALGPIPNGVYQTIEKTFHDIQVRMKK